MLKILNLAVGKEKVELDGLNQANALIFSQKRILNKDQRSQNQKFREQNPGIKARARNENLGSSWHWTDRPCSDTQGGGRYYRRSTNRPAPREFYLTLFLVGSREANPDNRFSSTSLPPIPKRSQPYPHSHRDYRLAGWIFQQE